MELQTRYYLALLAFVLNTINFYFGQERFSNKPKCLAKHSPLNCNQLISDLFPQNILKQLLSAIGYSIN